MNKFLVYGFVVFLLLLPFSLNPIQIFQSSGLSKGDVNTAINQFIRLMDWNAFGKTYFDQNVTLKDINVVFKNQLVMIGEAAATESGDALAVVTSTSLGKTYTCVYVITNLGLGDTCASSLGVRNVWAKVT